MDPRFRRQMFVTQGAIVLVCVLSAITAILALSFTNRTSATIRKAGDDIAAVGVLRLRLTRLAEAGERVLLADDGRVRFNEIGADVDRARVALRARGPGGYFAIDAEVLDRDADDFKLAINHAANALTGDPRSGFVTYRAALKPVRDAFDADATSLIHKLVAHRDEFSERTTSVATRARWALVFTAAVAILITLAFAAGVMRALARQRQHNRSAAEHAADDRLAKGVARGLEGSAGSDRFHPASLRRVEARTERVLGRRSPRRRRRTLARADRRAS